MTLARFGALATVLAVVLICGTSVCAATVSVRAVDPMGGGVPKVLVIVRAPANAGYEVLRALSGPDGSVPQVNVLPGLYEAIATDPYSPYLTTVEDFVVAEAPVKIELRMNIEQDQTASLDSIDWNVKVVDKQGRSVNDAWITARVEGEPACDVTATGSDGRATVTIPFDEPVIVTALYKGRTYTELIHVDAHVRDSEKKWLSRERAKLKQRSRTVTVSVD
jgi:hypothetical protein